MYHRRDSGIENTCTFCWIKITYRRKPRDILDTYNPNQIYAISENKTTKDIWYIIHTFTVLQYKMCLVLFHDTFATYIVDKNNEAAGLTL